MDIEAINNERRYIADVLEIKNPSEAGWQKIDRRLRVFERFGVNVDHLRARAANARRAIMTS